MLPAMVYLINVEDHVKLFKSIHLISSTPSVFWNFPSVHYVSSEYVGMILLGQFFI